MKTITGLILLFTLLLFGTTTLYAEELSQNELISRATQLDQSGESKQALSLLRSYIQQPLDNQQDSLAAWQLIGQILTREKQFYDVILYFERVPAHLRSAEMDLLLGNSLIETDQFEQGKALLRPLLDEPLKEQERTLLLQQLTTAALATGENLQALWFIKNRLATSLQPATLLSQSHEILQNRLTNAELEEAAFMWQGTELGQDASLQLARRQLASQQSEQARERLGDLLATPVAFPWWQEAEQLLSRSADDNWLSRDSIGVMLPLSGPFASYGKVIKQGLELALTEHNKNSLPVHFRYRDTASEETSPEDQVNSLCDDDKVMAIIGPLRSEQARQAATQAQQKMVPLLTLAQAEGLPEIGNFIFRDSLTAAQQVKALLDYALNNGNISFSVLYPENRYGQQMAQQFIAQATAAGGEIVDSISYPEETVDFKQQVARLLWQDPDKETSAETDETPALEYPLAPFHALFIPDAAERINQIAPQLRFYGIKDATLLGVNAWKSAELAEQSGRYLDHAVFVDSFYSASNNPQIKEFVALYQQTWQREPSILEAQAYASAQLLLRLLDDPAVSNREALRYQLSRLQNINGITGTLAFDLSGEAIKQLELLGFRHGKIVEQR